MFESLLPSVPYRQHKYKSFTSRSFVILWIQAQRYLVNSIKSTVFTVFQQVWQTYLNFSTRRSGQIWSKALPCMWLRFCVSWLLSSMGLVRTARTAGSFWSAGAGQGDAGDGSFTHHSSQLPQFMLVCICDGLQKWPKHNFHIIVVGNDQIYCCLMPALSAADSHIW